MSMDIAKRVFQQIFDLWINPEIEKRKSLNRLPNDFRLECAQIIFSLDRGGNKVRLNEEVKAIAKCKINCPKKEGELIYETDADKIESITLTDEDPNCAHITLLLFKTEWIISFDPRYNKQKVKDHIEASKEFLESAKENLKKNRLRPFFEDSFACAELSAKAILLQLPNKETIYDKSHESRIEQFRNWVVLGNAKPEHSVVLEQLNRLRPSARYLCSNEYKKEDPQKIITTLEEMIQFSERSIK